MIPLDRNQINSSISKVSKESPDDWIMARGYGSVLKQELGGGGSRAVAAVPWKKTVHSEVSYGTYIDLLIPQ